MNYLEEQKGEVEALESIYYGDVKILATEPYFKFSIPIKSEEYEPQSKNGLGCDLLFTYTEKYPDEPPSIEIENAENFMETYDMDLISHLDNEIAENLGMVMIFTLVSAAQEWLNCRWEEMKKKRDEEHTKKLKEEEEAERKRFEGTRVTVESFLKWKAKFEDETGIAKRREINEKEGRKLTGRELFMTDNTLNESDLSFLDGENVEVDESLFQELDDLDLDDDEDDEYHPGDVLEDLSEEDDDEDYQVKKSSKKSKNKKK